MAGNEGTDVEMLPMIANDGNQQDNDKDKQQSDENELIDIDTNTTTTPGGPDEPQEGAGQTTTPHHPAIELVELGGDDEEDENEDAVLARFLEGDRPTGADEPSHNVPKKININPWCISTSCILFIICIMVLITIFAPGIFHRSIRNMIHYMVDINRHNTGEGGYQITNLFMIFFVIFNTVVFGMCGNIDYILTVSCGYLYTDNQHEWLNGALVYIICNYIGCAVAFAIGRTLFKDRLYAMFSKNEKYRFFQRVFTDHSLLLSVTCNLNPFLPSGLIVYGLSISGMSWLVFFVGQAARIPNAAIMAYAGYVIRKYYLNDSFENSNIDDINSVSYKSNDFTYGFTVTFCVLFAFGIIFTLFAMYLQYQKLVLGDRLQRKQDDEEESFTEYSDKSVTDSNEDVDGDDNDDTQDDNDDIESSSSESLDTLDEYGFRNIKKKEEFLFSDTYNKRIADMDDNSYSNDPFKYQDVHSVDDVDSDSHGLLKKDADNSKKDKKNKKKTKNKKKKHQLNSERALINKTKKKKKKRTKIKKSILNNDILRTIVLASSPKDDDKTMLFEGPKYNKQSRGDGIAIQMSDHINNGNRKPTSPKQKASMSRSKKQSMSKNNKDDNKSPRSNNKPKSPIDALKRFKFSIGGNSSKKKGDDDNAGSPRAGGDNY